MQLQLWGKSNWAGFILQRPAIMDPHRFQCWISVKFNYWFSTLVLKWFPWKSLMSKFANKAANRSQHSLYLNWLNAFLLAWGGTVYQITILKFLQVFCYPCLKILPWFAWKINWNCFPLKSFKTLRITRKILQFFNLNFAFWIYAGSVFSFHNSIPHAKIV